MLWAFRALPQNLRVRIIAVIVATIVGYPLLGFYALAAILLMGIWTWHLRSNRSQNIILTIAVFLCIVTVPLFCYRYVYYQTNFDDI